MSRRTKFLLGLFVVIVAVDALFVLGSLRGCAAEKEEPKTGARTPDGSGRGRAGTREEPGSTELERDRVAESPASAERAEREAATAEWVGIVLAGRVEVPEGTPAEEGMEVICGTFDAEGGEPTRSPVARDGSFRARFPGAGTGWIELDSRWLLLELDENVDLRAPPPEIVLRPRIGACITGRVVLPEGFEHERVRFEVEDFELSQQSEDGAPHAIRDRLRLSTEPELALTSRALDPASKTSLRVQSSRFVAVTVPLQLEPGVECRVTVPLEPGLRVRGRVVDVRGAPIVEAFVHADPVGRSTSGVHQTRSSADGRYELCIGAKEIARVLVVATRDGYATARWDPGELRQGQVVDAPDFVLGSDRIAGRVVGPEGAPVFRARIAAFAEEASVPVWAQLAGGGVPSVRAETGPDGEFAIHVRSMKPHRLVASGIAGVAILAGVAPGTEGLELLLAPVAPFVVEVRDDGGRPFAGADVDVFAARHTEEQSFVEEALTTDATGRAWIANLPDGPWTIEARYGAFLGRATIEVGAVPGSEREHRFTFPRTASLAGRVLDARGQPARAVHLRLQPDDQSGAFDHLDHRLLGIRTDESGRYALQGLVPGSYRLAVIAKGIPMEMLELELAPGEERSDFDVDLSRRATIEVEVLDAEGRPDVGRNVSCCVERTNHTFSASTDATGRVRFEQLPQGRVRLSRAASGFAEMSWREDRPSAPLTGRARLLLTLAPGEERKVVLGGPAGAAQRLNGRISQSARPVGGIGVLVHDACEFPHGARSGDDGHFDVEVHDGSNVIVRLLLGSGSLEREVLAEEVVSGALAFELPAGELRGVVRGPDGKPVPEANVLVVPMRSAPGMLRLAGPWRGKTSSEGRFSFPFLEPGRYSVMVPATREAPREIVIPADSGPVEIVVLAP